MKTIEIKVYTFDELSDEAKDTARACMLEAQLNAASEQLSRHDCAEFLGYVYDITLARG